MALTIHSLFLLKKRAK